MANLVDPIVFTLAIVAAGISIPARFKYTRRVAILFGLFIYFTLATPFLSTRLITALQSQVQSNILSARIKPAVIVVLGGDLRHRSPDYGGDTVGTLSLERIRFGAKLHRQTALPIMTTGGKIGDSQKTVAAVMAEALKDSFKVPVKFVEENSRNTYENAQFSAELLNRNGINAVFLVTHAWHMPRALEAFRHAGLTAIPRGTGWVVPGPGLSVSDFIPNSGALRNTAYALHELVGRFWYHVVYY